MRNIAVATVIVGSLVWPTASFAKRMAPPPTMFAGDIRDAPVADVKPPKGFEKLAGAAWTDKSGSYYVLFSQQIKRVGNRDSRKLQADYFVLKGKKYSLLRAIKDQSMQCEFDNTTKFVLNSGVVADHDGDGTSEVYFAYTTGCRSDVSPDTLKLLVLEGKKKSILRGSTQVNGGDALIGGEFKPAEFPADGILLKKAVEHWSKVLKLAE